MSKVVLMDFFAEWCGPCKMQDPIIDEMKKKFGDKVEFRKVDVDTNYDLAAKYTIHAVPTLILEKDGAVFKRYVGVTNAKTLEADLNAALK
ncbi:thioredoxin [Candidatus Methanoperedens nitroreducens]|uniref:Thioredoxin n=2 Tax=Candidatus Methanoperedens nitratireducens TaxID=1392998 RepID=A0A062V9E7_9EURY|nr:thioredoxin [Candidatus Methanoperedens nitroreducens]MDJ1423687.1 thioredoxin [Candidatus Methanoperedens sp.]